MSSYNLKMEPVAYDLAFTSPELALSLSRVGGQGSKGNSVSNAQVNASGDLIITIVDASGATVQTINAGGGVEDGSITFGDWTITESGSSLYFATSGTNKMKLDASGNLEVVGNVTPNATIT